MIETDFGWALAKMRDGYRVRRSSWSNGESALHLKEGVLVLDHELYGPECPVNALDADVVLAFDWELAE